MKRLRNASPTKTIRYYMCGEYGENFSRPHYHACLFGHDFPDKEVFKEVEGIITYTSAILESIWTHGFCTIGELNFDTAAYTARYIAKKITGEPAADHYTTSHPATGELIHLEPEFNQMSLRPGIAKDWYDQYKTDIYPSDFLIHCGKTIKVPRYYDKLYELEGNDIEELKRKRKLRARGNPDNTPARLVVREKVKQLKYKTLSRNYENES